ncbi:MAG: prephenate dehydrogenase/arogenate dehydrogenase family protein [Armatimonadetes bacterium]|nr:prephenate dehydrogenase/arogenate dehydrogenase family protein [Armatimonadota bacterium]
MQIAIIGLGGIGASVGLGLGALPKPLFKRRLGYDIDPRASEGALALSAIDHAVASVQACAQAEVILIATPPTTLPMLFEQLAPHLSPAHILTDTASVKTPVLHWAKRLLPYPARFVGGHPIAGTEHHGWQSARNDLFHGAQWVLTPAPETDPDAIETVRQMVISLGATPVLMDAGAHDSEMALLSHLPHVLAFSLQSLALQSPPSLAGGGSWRSATRVAQSDPTLWAQILTLNREAVLEWLARLRTQLDALEDALQKGDTEAVERFLQRAKSHAE